MSKHCDIKGKRRRTSTSDLDSDLGSDEGDDNIMEMTECRTMPDEIEVLIMSDEEEEDDQLQWLLIFGLQMKEEGCELLTQADLHFDIVDVKYNLLTRCFGVLFEN